MPPASFGQNSSAPSRGEREQEDGNRRRGLNLEVVRKSGQVMSPNGLRAPANQNAVAGSHEVRMSSDHGFF